jgi:hypothetical protein
MMVADGCFYGSRDGTRRVQFFCGETGRSVSARSWQWWGDRYRALELICQGRLTACSVSWWLMAGAALFWEKSTGGWFVLREKYCWLVVDKPSEQDVRRVWALSRNRRGRCEEETWAIRNRPCHLFLGALLLQFGQVFRQSKFLLASGNHIKMV